MKAKQINLNIEEIVLNGFEIQDQYGVGVALESELQRLFSEQGVPSSMQQGGVISTLQTNGNNLKANAGADVIGIQVAQNIYNGMTR